MSVTRQGLWFVVVGSLQLLVDWLAFVLLTAFGLPVVAGNVAARLLAAGSGFWLNGRITFAGRSGPRLGGRRLLRFFVLWLALTALSTVLMSLIAGRQGLEWAWLAKPVVEAFLAAVSFMFQRHWVYR